uniref:DUF1995 domain-containing protein n=2 Tax=Hemiselmis andersenii TaxID=464988 RepID=A0A7S1GVZ0_HEMAN
MEVEFPPIPSLNKLSDGSASSQRMVRNANVDFVLKVAEALSGSGWGVWILCGDSSTREEVVKRSLPPNTQVALLRDGPPPSGPSDVLLVHPPADISQWDYSASLSASSPVVALNGQQHNGHSSFEMAYYLKPMTFNSRTCGYLIRSLPGAWTVYDSQGADMGVDVGFVQTASGFRPDLQAISRLFM